VCTPPNTCFLGPTRVQIQNGILIDSAVFAWLITVSDHATQSGPHLRTYSRLRCGLILSVTDSENWEAAFEVIEQKHRLWKICSFVISTAQVHSHQTWTLFPAVAN